MADSKRRRLEQFQAAGHPLRFRLLEHACTRGPFSTADAARITKTSPTSGNARTTHADGLCDVGLLSKTGRPAVYAVTSSGRLVYDAIAAALPRRAGQQHDAPVALLALIQGTSVDELAGAEDLVVALTARLKRASGARRTVYRLQRADR